MANIDDFYLIISGELLHYRILNYNEGSSNFGFYL